MGNNSDQEFVKVQGEVCERVDEVFTRTAFDNLSIGDRVSSINDSEREGFQPMKNFERDYVAFSYKANFIKYNNQDQKSSINQIG